MQSVGAGVLTKHPPLEPGPEGNYHLILKGNYHLTLKVDLTKGIIILLNLTLQRVISPYSESYLTYQAPLACPDSMVLYNGVPLACSSLRSNPTQLLQESGRQLSLQARRPLERHDLTLDHKRAQRFRRRPHPNGDLETLRFRPPRG